MPIIQLVAFRGTGGVFDDEHERFGENPLIRTGHVSLGGVIEGKLIGFSPTPEATEAIGGMDNLLEALRNYQPQPGRLQDDTAIFERAYELAVEHNERTTVYVMDIDVSDETVAEIKKWYNEKREAFYNLPSRGKPEFADNEFNCATFPQKFGVTIPIMTGKLSMYIEIMKIKGAKAWTPNNRNP
jgi:hypothetical protein